MVKLTSRREGLLWGTAGAAVIATYAGAALAGALTSRYPEPWLPDAMFGVGFVLVLSAIVGIALQSGTSRGAAWLGVGAAASLIFVLVRLGTSPADRTHVVEYALISALVHQAMLERRARGASVRAPLLRAIAVVVLLGWADEGLQSLLPGRVHEIRDVATNTLAAVGGALVSAAVSRWRAHRKPV